MEQPKLTPERAEQIITLLRDNPGVEMTLGDIADNTDIPVEEVGAHMEDLLRHQLVIQSTTEDGFDVFQFPVAFQRGAT